ncbi:MAG TPA: glycosyltransferase, partial [Gemmatimonadaceae bacterium]
MSAAPYVLIALPIAIFAWAYAGYPAVVWIASRFKAPRAVPPEPSTWPMISITVPAYNEAARIRSTIDSLLAIDYPAERRQILIVSDSSIDDTDRIVAEYADRGVELYRVSKRGGKTAAENASAAALRGEIIVNTDASIRIQPHAVKALVRALQDPTIGVASGRDISVGAE